MTAHSWDLGCARRHVPRALFRALAVALACATFACTSGRETGPRPAREPAGTLAEVRAPAGDSGLSASAAPMGPRLSEAAARALLAERFRAAGLRIRYDVAVHRVGSFELTVDGYDPQALCGFEYVAEAERDTDLDASEREALEGDREYRILVIDETDEAGLSQAAQRFLAEIRPAAE